ncbi:Protein CBG15631 [Caenorhabditis briggsae]|uniref:Protein CBG15631 n=1 Tax=Caenorhabditis briggsae TaxID=6238 RepID=A8XMF1_CAEBR|nr:Protein CBG15631 [Caenorhabditis briggsae]CAP33827.2 Protein CBG15631 [Caenorhabditis briggsae]
MNSPKPPKNPRNSPKKSVESAKNKERGQPRKSQAAKPIELFVETARSRIGFPKKGPGRKSRYTSICLYGCAFNPYAYPEHNQLVAVCGETNVHVFKITDADKLEHIWATSFEPLGIATDRKEILYSVAWAYDTYEADHHRPAHKIVAGGVLGHVYVIDLKTKNLDNTLRSFGGDINDIRVNPADSNLIACASGDQSIRIHHIRNQSCLITIGGPLSHPSAVLSVDWNSDGNTLITCGFDHQLMSWDLSVNPAKEWLDKTCDELKNGKKNIFFQSSSDGDRSTNNIKITKKIGEDTDKAFLKEVQEELHRPHDNTLNIYAPSAVITDLHSDYMDCVRFLLDSELFLSKGSGCDPHLNISRFGLPKGIKTFPERRSVLEPEQSVTNYAWYKNPEGWSWYHKCAIDPMRKFIGCAGSGGTLFFFKIEAEAPTAENHEPVHKLKLTDGGNVRNVDFSPCGRYVVATTSDGYVVRMDRMLSDDVRIFRNDPDFSFLSYRKTDFKGFTLQNMPRKSLIMSSSPSKSSPVAPLTITNYSFILAADNHLQNDQKKTFLNVEYEYQNSTHHAQIPMHKDEFAEIRGDLNSSRIVDLLKSKH